jgi:hypothetical protein
LSLPFFQIFCFLAFSILKKTCPPIHNIFEAYYNIYFLFQQTILSKLLEILNCKNFQYDDINNNFFLKKYLGVECFNSNHIFWILCLVLPSILIFGIITPLSTICFSYKNKHLFQEKQNILKYDFMMRQLFYKHSSVW